jgi:uncharacterized membrane protein
MASNTTKTILHDSFRIGIAIKGFDGILEMVAGVALWFVSPAQMSAFVKSLTEHMLTRIPHSYISKHLLAASQGFTNDSREFAAYYLLSHGFVKVVLVICLWMNKLWAYPLTIAVFGLFMLYQVHRYTQTHSVSMILLTIFDGLIIYLTWMEFKRQEKRIHDERAGGAEPAAK